MGTVGERTKMVGVESDLRLDALGLAVVALAVGVAGHDCCASFRVWIFWYDVQSSSKSVLECFAICRDLSHVGSPTSSSMDLSGLNDLALGFGAIDIPRPNWKSEAKTSRWLEGRRVVFQRTGRLGRSSCQYYECSRRKC